MRASCALALVSHAAACSLAIQKGVQIGNIDQTHSQGASMTNRIRLRLDDFGNQGTVLRTTQAVLDFASGTLEAHDSAMEWMPTVLGYDDCTATGSLDVVSGTVSLTWRPYCGASVNGSASFSLPNVTRAVWWYSDSLARVFFAYELHSTNERRIASCSTGDGMCSYGPAPSLSGSYFVSGAAAAAWDSEQLVGIPLTCCVCRSYDYFRFDIAADSTPSLTIVPALNTLGPTHYDVATKEAWGVSGLSVTRYSYATQQTASLQLTPSQLDRLFDSGGLPDWAIALIALSGAAVLLLAGVAIVRAAGWKPWSRKAEATRRLPDSASTIQVHKEDFAATNPPSGGFV